MGWYVLLTPLLLAPVAMLLVFVGCKSFGTSPTPAPPPTGTGTPPGTGPTGPTGGTGPAPPQAPTLLQLNAGPSLQGAMGAGSVTKLSVQWTLDRLAPPDPQPLAPQVQDPFVATTPVVSPPVGDAVVGGRDLVKCTCTVTWTGVLPGAVPVDVTAGPAQMTLVPHGAVHVFTLEKGQAPIGDPFAPPKFTVNPSTKTG